MLPKSIYVTFKNNLRMLKRRRRLSLTTIDLLKKLKLDTFSNIIENGIFTRKLSGTYFSNINRFFFNIISEVNRNNFNEEKNTLINKITNKIFVNKLRKIYIYKYYTSLLYINSLKFKMTNLLGLTNILSKIYNKKVIINVVNLKYLFLDSSIFVNAVVRKINDRKKRIRKVLKKGLKMIKKGKISPNLLLKKSKDLPMILANKYKLNFMNLSNYLSNSINNDNLSFLDNNKSHTSAFQALHNKFLIGFKLQGTGRLTRRLTASRSQSKYRKTGNFKNIYSSHQGISTVMLKGYAKSNLQYVNMNSKNRNGSFSIKN